MLDHVSIGVSDLAAGIGFYDAVLATIGFKRCMTHGESAGYGRGAHAVFWIGAAGPEAVPAKGFHVAFQADDRGGVDTFHAAALASGADDNGAPGIRSRYHPNYYAAFALDPDGHHLEVVCRRPE